MEPGDQSELNAASERLDQALARLAAGLKDTREQAERVGTLESERARLAGELEALQGERDRLAKQLDTTEHNYAALEKTADTVVERLDSTIDQLKTVLDG